MSELLDIHVNVSVNGRFRNLLSMNEKKTGDVYIRLISGSQIGIPPHAKAIKEDRYSIHVSPKSDTYTTLKKTFAIEDGPTITRTALTNAVKLKSGFSLLFVHRFTDLMADVYNNTGDEKSPIILDGYDPTMSTLFACVLIGPKDLPFPDTHSKAGIVRIRSRDRLLF